MKVLARVELKKIDNFVRSVKRFFQHCGLSFEEFVLWFFQTLNHRGHIGIPSQKIREETNEHIDHLSLTLKQVVLPLSLGYTCLGFLLGNNVVDSLFLSVLIFVYSNFLPDLLSPFRIRDRREKSEDETWYRKYALLFFAPICVFLLWGHEIPILRTAENFHNAKSFGAYSVFLFLLGLILYGNMPFSLGRILEIFSPMMFGSIGYVAHLKVDEIL